MNFNDVIQKLDEWSIHTYDKINGFKETTKATPEETNVAKYIAAFIKKNGSPSVSPYELDKNKLVITITSIDSNGIARGRVVTGENGEISDNFSMDMNTKQIKFSKSALNIPKKERDFRTIEAEKKISQGFKKSQDPKEKLKLALNK